MRRLNGLFLILMAVFVMIRGMKRRRMGVVTIIGKRRISWQVYDHDSERFVGFIGMERIFRLTGMFCFSCV